MFTMPVEFLWNFLLFHSFYSFFLMVLALFLD